MAAQADRILLEINAQTSGTPDLARLSGLVSQLGNDMRVTGRATDAQRAQIAAAATAMQRLASTYAAGSAEAQQAARAAAALQRQLAQIDARNISDLSTQLRGVDTSAAGARAALQGIITSAQAMRAGFAAGSAEAERLEQTIRDAQRQLRGMDDRSITDLERSLQRAGRSGTAAADDLRRVAAEARLMAGGFAAGSAEAQRLARVADQAEDQLRQLAAAEARAAQEARNMDRDTRAAGGGFTRLQAGLVTLQSGLGIVQQITQGVAQMVTTMTAWADAANKSATDTKVFELTLAKFSVSVDQANGAAERLATKFGLSVEEVKGSMTNLIRVGFRDMGQLEQLMTGAAASSIAFGRTASEGFDRIGDAAVTGLSAALNSIGIAENLGPAYDKAAKALGKTADALTDAERATVLYNLVVKATGTEVAALDTIQNDYVRSQQAASLAQKDFTKAMGELTLPLITQVNRQGASLVTQMVEVARAFGKNGDGLEGLAKKYPELSRAMQVIAPVAQQMQTTLSGIWITVQSSVQNTLLPAMKAIEPVVRQVWAQVPALIQSGGRFIEETFRLIDALWRNVLKPVWDQIGPTVQAAVGLVISLLRGMFDLVSSIFKSVGQLIDGDWRGAMNTMSDAAGRVGELVGTAMEKVWNALKDLAPKAWQAAKNLGNSIKDGILSGVTQLEILLAESVGKAMQNMLGYIPDWAQRMLGIAQNGESESQYGNPQLGNLGNLQDMAAGLGVDGFRMSQGFGQNKNQLGYGPNGHNGVDYATPVGTKLFAPFAGQVVMQQDKWLGRMVTLIDAEGRKLVLGHLSEFNQELLKTITAAGHSVAIARGTFLGKTGGALSDPLRGNSTGPHLHLGMYDARGRLQNPERYGVGIPNGPGFARPTAPAPAPAPTSGGTTPPPAPTPTPDAGDKASGPISSAQIARAQQLLAALEKAKKALEAKPGDVGLIKAFDAADQSVKAWTKDNESNARALAAVQAGMGGVKTAAGTYIATQADLRKYGNAALLLIKEQERASASGNSAEIERVRGKVTMFQEAGKAQAAVFSAEQAAYQARKAASDRATASEQELQAARTQAAQQLAALGATQLQQRVAAEEAAGEAIEGQRERRLEQTTNDLELTLKVEQNYARRSLAQARETAQAQLVLAKRTAEQAFRDSVASIPEKASAAQRKALTDAAAAVRDGAVSAAYRDHYAAIGDVAAQGAERVQAAQAAIKKALDEGFEQADRLAAQMDPGMESRRDVPQLISLETIIANLPTLASEVPGFEKALRELNAEGKITADVLETALLLMPEFSSELNGMSAAAAEVEKKLETQAKRFDDLNTQYDDGLITQDAYRDGVRALADSYDLQAQAAERANKPELVAFFRAAEKAARDAAAGIRTMSDELAEIAQRGADALWLAQNPGEVGPITERTSTDADGNITFGDPGGFEQALTDTFSGTTAEQLAQAINLTTTEAWADAGQEARERFWARFADLQGAPDFQDAVSGFSAQTLYGLTQAMGTDEGWATLKAQFSARFAEVLTSAAPEPDALEGLLGDVSDTINQAAQQYDLGQISAEEYNAALTGQADVLTAVYLRLSKLGPEYAEAARSVQLMIGATLGMTQATQAAEPALSAAEQQLADMVISLLPLTDGLRNGTLSMADFVAAAREAIPKLEALAKAAALAGNNELAAQYRALAGELRDTGGQALKTADGFDKFKEYAGYAQDLAGAFGKLAGATGNSDLEANLNGIANAAGQAIALAGDVARIIANPADVGAWVGAITKVVSGIADALNGYRKARAEMQAAQKEFASQFSIIDATAFSSFSLRSRGWFADTFGGGPELVKQINETAATIAKAIESGVKGGFSNGIKSFLNGTGDLLTGIREGVRGAIIDAVTEALIQGAILKGALGDLLTQLTTTLAAGQDPSGIIAQIGAALPAVAQTLEATLKPIKTALDKALPSTTGAGGSSGGASFGGGGGGTFQAAVPTVVIDILSTARDLLRAANEAPRLHMEAARLNYRAAELMYASAQLYAGPHNSSTGGAR